jgi:hypothetical protein
MASTSHVSPEAGIGKPPRENLYRINPDITVTRRRRVDADDDRPLRRLEPVDGDPVGV